MLRFVVDAQLPPGLATRLRASGFEAEHVNKVGLGPATDLTIWDYASRHRAVLITKDADFVAFAKSSHAGPQVVWIRIGNISNDALWRAVSVVLDEIVSSLEEGERVVEVV
jgi:predicted nuclease of predicted toxin-antitoxin system